MNSVYILRNYNPENVIDYFESLEGAMTRARGQYRGELHWNWVRDGFWRADGTHTINDGITQCTITRVDLQP